jgi:hypothetical protein
MKINFHNNRSGVGRVTLCAPQIKAIIDGAHGVTRPTLEGLRAFTMIEIAIALAVIAFALVAIIGVLPTGLTVQKDNREDTIVNQDGPYWLEAIRTGAQGLDHLTNYVEIITIKSEGRNASGKINQTVIYTNSPNLFAPPYNGSMTNGQRIVGLLTTPKYVGEFPDRVTNTVTARVRALTGAAVEHGKVNAAVAPITEFSFSYLLVPEVTSFKAVLVNTNSTNFLLVNETLPVGTTPEQSNAIVQMRRIAWIEVQSRERNTSEIRLTFQWPLLGNDRTGPNRQSFRAIISGEPKDVLNNGLVMFQPQQFQVVLPPP